jgi:hypothetical protein
MVGEALVHSLGMGEEVYKIILTCGAEVLSLNKIFESRTTFIFFIYIFYALLICMEISILIIKKCYISIDFWGIY